MAFTYLPGTPLGQLRARIGDTVIENGVLPNQVNFSDDELLAALDEFGTVDAASAAIFERLAAEWGRMADVRIGEYAVNNSAVAEQYRNLATRVQERLADDGSAQGNSGRITTGKISFGAYWS